MSENVTLYGHAFCPMVGPIKRMLNQCNVAFDYINIHRDPEARERVRDINNGYESVPTLVFPDGSTLTEPSTGELKRKLETMGVDVPFMALVYGNAQMILLAAFITLMLLRIVGVF